MSRVVSKSSRVRAPYRNVTFSGVEHQPLSRWRPSSEARSASSTRISRRPSAASAASKLSVSATASMPSTSQSAARIAAAPSPARSETYAAGNRDRVAYRTNAGSSTAGRGREEAQREIGVLGKPSDSRSRWIVSGRASAASLRRDAERGLSWSARPQFSRHTLHVGNYDLRPRTFGKFCQPRKGGRSDRSGLHEDVARPQPDDRPRPGLARPARRRLGRRGSWGSYPLRDRPGRGPVVRGLRRIHTLGMRTALDIVFLDRALRVLRSEADVRPQRMYVGARHAHVVAEFGPGFLKANPLEAGDDSCWSRSTLPRSAAQRRSAAAAPARAARGRAAS